MSSRPDLRRKALPILSLALLASAAAIGCAAPQKPQDVVWPPPPDKPRVKYVRSISAPEDIDVSFSGKMKRGILGGGSELRLLNPNVVAIGPDETKLYVSCGPISLVVEIDLTNGRFRDPVDDSFRPARPWGVALDALGNLYVSDEAQRLVWVYGPNGRFIRQIGKGLFTRPTGIAVDRQRQRLYVVDGGKVDTQDHRVEVFALDGTHIRSIGKRGDAPGLFNFPAYVAVAPDGTLYVSDTLNFRVQAFDADGNFRWAMGGVGALGKVKGIAFDSFGNMHLVDARAGAVHIYNPKRQELMTYGGTGPSKEFMTVPNGIAIDSKNNMYVADYAMHHVNQYLLFNTKPEDLYQESPVEGETSTGATTSERGTPVPGAAGAGSGKVAGSEGPRN